MTSKTTGGVSDTTVNQTKSNAAMTPERHNRNILSQDGKQLPDRSDQQKRIIRQIVTLDSQKLKDLGIESNILSAMSKLNGKTNDGNKSALPSAVHQRTSTNHNSNRTIASASVTVKSEAEKEAFQTFPSIKSTIIPPVSAPQANLSNKSRKAIANTSTERCTKPNANISTNKKVHVLSNVVLNDGKLVNLQQLTSAIKAEALIKPSNVLIGKHGKLSTITSPVSDQNNLKSNRFEESANDTHRNNDLYLHVKRLLSKKPNESVNPISDKQTVHQNRTKSEPTPSTSQKRSSHTPISGKSDKCPPATSKLLASVIESHASEAFLGFPAISCKEQQLLKEKIEKLNQLLNLSKAKSGTKQITLPIKPQSKSTVSASISIKCDKKVRTKSKDSEIRLPPTDTKSKVRSITHVATSTSIPRQLNNELPQLLDVKHSDSFPNADYTHKLKKHAEKAIESDERYKKPKAKTKQLNSKNTRKKVEKQSSIDDLLNLNRNSYKSLNDSICVVGSIAHLTTESIVEEECGQFSIPEPIKTEITQPSTLQETKINDECDISVESSLNLGTEMTQNKSPTAYKSNQQNNSRKKHKNDHTAVETILNIDTQQTASTESDTQLMKNTQDNLNVHRHSSDLDAMNEQEDQTTPKRKRGRPSKASKLAEAEQRERKRKPNYKKKQTII